MESQHGFQEARKLVLGGERQKMYFFCIKHRYGYSTKNIYDTDVILKFHWME